MKFHGVVMEINLFFGETINRINLIAMLVRARMSNGIELTYCIRCAQQSCWKSLVLVTLASSTRILFNFNKCSQMYSTKNNNHIESSIAFINITKKTHSHFYREIWQIDMRQSYNGNLLITQYFSYVISPIISYWIMSFMHH